MALVKCPECEKEVSDKTENCIHCGYFFNTKKHMSNVSKILVEQTDKKWKMLKLVAFFMFIFSIVGMFSDNILNQFMVNEGMVNERSHFGTGLFISSIFLYIFAVFGTWWHHK